MLGYLKHKDGLPDPKGPLSSCLRVHLQPDGPKLMEQAKTIAQRLSIDGFKASNGWLQKWKTSHNLKCRTVSGEW